MTPRKYSGARVATVLSILLLSVNAAFGSDLPVTFDLRNVDGENFVTSVKSQQGGTCWTHGAMAAMEGNLLMTGIWTDSGEEGEPDLAEYHLDWWNGFNQFNNDDTDPPSGGGLEVHMGGDYLVTAAYLSRGEGAVRDVDGQSFVAPPARNLSTYRYYWPREIEWMTVGDSLENIDRVKLRLMEGGVIGTCLCSSSSFINGDFIHYQPDSSPLDPNHAVSIVGWNDTLQTQAPLPGAWLCKNSWGYWWGLDGYFWISYYDKHSGHNPQMGAISMTLVEPMTADTVYHHDYHGWRKTLKTASDAFNSFIAVDGGMLEEVSFYTAEDSVEYTVQVFSSFQTGQLSGLLSEVSGQAGFVGLHTVQLAQSVPLDPGQEFFIRLLLEDGGQPYDCTSDVPVLLGASYRTIVESTAEPGQSWFRDGGSWVDLTTVDSTANFCIKGIAYGRGLNVDHPDLMVFSGEPGGRFTPSGYQVVLSCRDQSPAPYAVRMDPAVDWLDLSGELSGILTPYESQTVAISLNANAPLLDTGSYSTELVFENLADSLDNMTLQVLLLSGSMEVVYTWDMEQDPGWTTEGEWAYGIPQGMGGEHGYPDPTSGVTGDPVYGYNLRGDYANDMPEYSLTAGPVDCSGLHQVTIRFARWLGVQEYGFDRAALSVSSDGEEWVNIWSNLDGAITDSAWVTVEYDLSEVADEQPEVFIRWSIGPTNMGWTFCGWNLDDVELLAIEDRGAGGLLPQELVLDAAHPNPFSSSTEVGMLLPLAGTVEASVYDLQGRQVAVIGESEMIQGPGILSWDGCDALGRRMPPGIYLLLVRTEFASARTKLMLIY